ncbi:hypothetical protein [Egicoccus sp. AB-alg6-2]|uniref:hypothetical protein n=1 Tax=Egicoccus sp. AB-alg6-2 TaxID=3242692 RepID=UPI00359D68A8
MSDADGNAELEITEHEDGWAVTRDGEVLSTHGSRAGAEADRFRLAEADASDAEEADAVLTDEQGAHPDNAGS